MVGPRVVAIWVAARSSLRRHRAAWLGLALLVGLTGGFVVAAAAGARRTGGAYDRLLAGAAPFDVAIGCAALEENESCSEETRPSLRAALARPEVRAGTIVTTAHVPITTTSGVSLQPEGDICFGGPGEVDVVGSSDNTFGTSVNRFRFVAGRRPDPNRADEASLSLATAHRVGVDVGDRLLLTPVDACGDVPQSQWPSPSSVTVVGLTVAPGEVQPVTGMYLQSVVVTPPQLARLTARGPSDLLGLVRLRDGVGVPTYLDALRAAGSPLGPVIVQRDLTASVADSLRPDATTLALLAVLGGFGALIVLAQMFTRQVWVESTTVPVSRALGFTRRDLAAAGAVKGAVVGTGGALVAIVIATVASPLTPIGRARRIEYSPGVRVDGAVFASAAIAIVIVVTLLVAAATWLVAGRVGAARRTRRRPSVTATTAERVALTTTMRVGAQMATDGGRDERAATARSGVVGAAIGLVAVFGAVTFAAGLDHLFATNRLVGINWDAGYFGFEAAESGTEPDFDALLTRVRAIDGVERAGFATFWPTFGAPIIDERFATWHMAFTTDDRSVSPTVESGRAPRRDDEVLLAAHLIERLDRNIGDALVLHGETASAEGTGPVPTSGRFTIVGVGVVPAPNTLDLGVALTIDGLRRLDPRAGPNALFLDFAPGADRGRVRSSLEALGFRSGGAAFERRGVDFVGLDLRQADLVPRLLGMLMAVLAAAVIVHVVLSGKRAHRRDLATLRALGFTGAQVRAALAWSAMMLVGCTLAVAALLGTAAGFVVWERYATRLDVVPEGAVPWTTIALVGTIVLLFAALVAVASAVGVLRRPASYALHEE